MATGTALQTYHISTGNREDLMDVITRISPEETPFFSSFGKTKASNTYHEWLTETLATPATNAAAEGAAYSFAVRTGRTRVGNYTQIFVTPVSVADTQRAVDAAGIEDEFDHQMVLAMKEHARDIEIALVTGTAASGASGTARKLKGVLDYISDNVTTGTGTGSETLTETMFNDALEGIWADGGLLGEAVAFPNSYQKRKISSFTASSTRNVDADEKKLFNLVEVYESDFGTIQIKKHRWMTTTVVPILSMDYWKVAMLRPTAREMVAKTGDATDGVIKTELTLESREEKASGEITQLATS